MANPLTQFEKDCILADAANEPCTPFECNQASFYEHEYKPCEECGRKLCPDHRYEESDDILQQHDLAGPLCGGCLRKALNQQTDEEIEQSQQEDALAGVS
jgi:hypothetical protein